MTAILYTIGIWFLASALPRILVGAGLTVLSFALISTLAETLVNDVVSLSGSIPSAVYNVLGLFGFIEAISMILSAYMVRAAIMAATVRLGVAS